VIEDTIHIDENNNCFDSFQSKFSGWFRLFCIAG